MTPSTGMRQDFSEDDDAMIRYARRHGHTAQSVGKKLKRTEGAIRHRAIFLGVPWRKEPGSSALVQTTQVDLSADQKAEMAQREADRRFVRAVLIARWRGEDVQAGQPKPVRPFEL